MTPIAILCSNKGCGRLIALPVRDFQVYWNCSCGAFWTVPPTSIRIAADACQPVMPSQPSPASAIDARGTSIDFVQFLHTMREAHERINNTALEHLVDAVIHHLKEFERQEEGNAGADVLLAFVLYPDGSRLSDVQFAGLNEDSISARRIRELAEKIEIPPVVNRPLGFLARRRLWGGAPNASTVAFTFPFSDRHSVDQPMSWDDYLAHIAPGGWKPEPPTAAAPRGLFARLFGQSKSAAAPITWKRGRTYSGDERKVILEGWERECEGQSLEVLKDRDPTDPKYAWARSERWMNEKKYAEAAADCTRVLELLGNDPTVLARRAMAYIAQGKMEAIGDLDAALGLDPDHVDALAKRGRLNLELRRYDKAEPDLTRLVALNPNEPEGHQLRADCLIRLGRQEEAQREFDEYIRVDPNQGLAYGRRGSFKMAQGHASGSEEVLRSALGDFDRACFLDPDFEMNFSLRAKLRMMFGDLAGALEDASRVIELNPDMAAIQFRGSILHQSGRYKECLGDLDKVIAAGSAGLETYQMSAAARLMVNDHEGALRDAAAGLIKNPEDPALHRCQGSAHLHLGQFEKAVEAFTKAIERAPQWMLPRYERGIAYRQSNQNALAIADLDLVAQTNPEGAPTYLERAQAKMALKEWQLAEEDFTRFLNLEKSFAGGWMGRARCRIQLGRLDDAEKDFDALLEMEPENVMALYQRAQIRSSQENLTGAMTDCDQLVELCPGSGSVYSGRARLWMALGEAGKAAADFKKSIALDASLEGELIVEQLMAEATDHFKRFLPGDAIRFADQALARDEGRVDAYFIRAGAHWDAGHFVEAIDDYSTFLEHVGEDSAVLSARGQVHAELGDFDAALVDLDRSIELDRASGASDARMAAARAGRAWALAGLGRHEEAAAELARSIQGVPESGFAHYTQGLAYDALGKKREAALSFELALQVDNPALPTRKRAKATAYLESLTTDAPTHKVTESTS